MFAQAVWDTPRYLYMAMFLHEIRIGGSISSLDFSEFSEFQAVVLSDVQGIDLEAFERFGTKNRKYLPYGERPSFSFSGEVLDEVAPHFDGVSAEDVDKIPEHLIFWAEQELESGLGGEYIV